MYFLSNIHSTVFLRLYSQYFTLFTPVGIVEEGTLIIIFL